MKLFTTGKIPLYCEAIGHRIERRKSGDTKVVDLTLTMDPFTSQHASALDREYTFVKRLLFKQSDATPTRDLRSATFAPPNERQLLTIFSAPDSSKAWIALDQVKVTGLRVRGAKDGDRWILVIKLSFGPVGKTELEAANEWYCSQRFVSFEQADPSLFEDGEATDGEDDDDDDQDDSQPALPAHEFDTDAAGHPVEAAAASGDETEKEPVRQRLTSHAGGKSRARTH